MPIGLVKWVAIALLLFSLLFWNSVLNYQLAVELIVTLSAVAVAQQARTHRKPLWSAAFFALALFFGLSAAAGLLNPLAPALPLAGVFGAFVTVFSIGLFALSFFVLRPQPQLS